MDLIQTINNYITAAKRNVIVAVDFDGTLVDHQFPDIGPEVPGAVSVLRELQEGGAQIILWTMRSDSDKHGPTLSDAVQWCRDRGIQLTDVNNSESQKSWTSSPKVYAHVYIDDAALGCPLREHPNGKSKRKCVDWDEVRKLLIDRFSV